MVSEELEWHHDEDRGQEFPEVFYLQDLVRFLGDLEIALRRDRDDLTVSGPDLFESSLSWSSPVVAITTTGIFSSISAIGPCFISPAA